MERIASILDKIASLIPGYIGYAERQGRRTCDKKLRDSIVSKINLIENEIQAKINSAISSRDTHSMNALDACRKRLNTLKSKIEYASYGETSLFSDKQIKENELREVYIFDLELSECTNTFVNSVSNANLEYITQVISEIESIFEKRSQYLRQF